MRVRMGIGFVIFFGSTPWRGHLGPAVGRIRLSNENPAAIGSRARSLHRRSPRGAHLPIGTGALEAVGYVVAWIHVGHSSAER